MARCWTSPSTTPRLFGVMDLISELDDLTRFYLALLVADCCRQGYWPR